ncbi:MAG: nucleotidyl transferase AbiEii/AbiGii toxin family protein [Gammaproteobacteria bacterium]|nr:nucleotidyl transferase AbiEii/AbiGii toxin family protein [Gammaproteobacteria bacterium]
MALDSELINDVATELNVDASFIEKDYYAVKVVQAIADYSHSEITPIFSGGTSLSKGYGILKRFSEDVDFRAQFKNGTRPTQGNLKAFRYEIYGLVESIEGITLDKERRETGGNYFKIPLVYPQIADVSTALRPHLQLDFSYTQVQRDPEECSISSFVAEYSNSSPEARILCLSPLETAAEKFSALIWRVNKRNRDDGQDDPAMIRHLHDLYVLRDYVHSHDKEFWAMVHTSAGTDENKLKRSTGMALPEAIKQMLDKLKRDKMYEEEYESFVLRMSYAKSQNLVSFGGAIDFLSKLTEKI